MADPIQDVRYGLRRMARTPGFSILVILTLAIGIGANTAIFSIINTVLLRALPYPEPGELVMVTHHYPTLNDIEAPLSGIGFTTYKERNRVFENFAVTTGWQADLTGIGDPERIGAGLVSAEYFATFGKTPFLGRDFLPEEDEPGNERVVILSHRFWQERLGGRQEVLGEEIQLNGEPHVIVGVMPADFKDFFNDRRELWRPLALSSEERQSWDEWIQSVGRLREGIDLEQAHTEMDAMFARLGEEDEDFANARFILHLRTLDELAKGRLRTPLMLLMGAVAFVLLIVVANVANLLLARSVGRIKEIAVRRALGSGRGRLMSQLMTESVLMALVGGVFGVLLAGWGIRLIQHTGPAAGTDVAVAADPKVLLFTLGVSLFAGLLFGLLPSLQTSKADIAGTLREGGIAGRADRSGSITRKSLVVAEIALALTLLTGAGLLIRSFAEVQAVDPGFQPEGVLSFNINLPDARYQNAEAYSTFYDQLIERLEALPGVEAAGVTAVLPFSGNWWTSSFSVEGYTPPEDQPNPWGDIRIVSPSYRETMQIPLLQGRFLEPTDDVNGPTVVVVDQELVRRYITDRDPLTTRITFDDPEDEDAEWSQIVGVVAHTAHEGLDADPRIQVYGSYRQRPSQGMWVTVRTAGEPTDFVGAVRSAVFSVDPELPIANVETMTARIEESVGQRQLLMLMLALFAAIALLLATLGIYGIMSHSVVERSREIGIRMALGARPGSVLGMVLRQGALLAGLGLLIGAAGAIGVSRLVSSQVFGITPTDPLTLVTVAVILAATALLACLLPAGRAARTDPIKVLRRE